MKQEGKCIVGDIVRVDNYTSDWLTVRLHPATYYRRHQDFDEGFKELKGLYTEFDYGDFVQIRFSDKDDLTSFYRRHHNYI